MQLSSILLLPALLGAAGDALPPNWKMFSQKAAGFTVAMPELPKEKKQKVDTATGQLQVTLYVAEGRDDSVFVVSHSDLPEADLKKGSVDRRLDQARDSAVSSARGKLRGEKPLMMNGHPGREITIENPRGAVIVHMRIFLVQHRLYQIMVLGDGSFSAKEVAFFMDSFRLIK